MNQATSKICVWTILYIYIGTYINNNNRDMIFEIKWVFESEGSKTNDFEYANGS